MTNKIELIEKEYLKEKPAQFNVGDTVRVYVKIFEEEKVRLQPFEGIVIRKRGSGIRSTFTVRRISYGEGVERIFPLHSPNIDKIEVIKEGKTRRAKLYFLRKKIGKDTKIEEKKEFKEKDTQEQEPPKDAE
ncbi:MAG: 50S ribosomal protein L19 [Candidatus Omnitrophica bacterium]|nr:50S ribosomal protein L19 [Candidatus Omnitrophota bacterium]